MNILIISNGAPNYFYFFNSIAKKFSESGNTICYAVDCKTSLDENKIIETGFSHELFSSYFASHKINQKTLDNYAKYNLNAALLSDYERAAVYKIWGKKNNAFYNKLKSALLCFFEDIFSRRKIDTVLYENVSNSFAHFCWFVCKEHGVRYLGLSSTRLPGRFWITDDPLKDHRRIDETLNKINCGKITISDETVAWCRSYIKNIDNISPDYMSFNNLDNTNIKKKYFKTEKLKKIITGLRHIRDDHYHSYQRGNPLLMSWNLFNRSLKRRFKVERIKAFYTPPSPHEKFILYPLHFHPESSTSILSGTYLDEFEVIRNIAFNLPQNLHLYVKDHISAFGLPSLDFYRKLSNLPNVRLIAPNAQTKNLIRNSEAVITLTSTVGYEALLLNKPVFLFGEVFYKNHKNVMKIQNPSKIFEYLSVLHKNRENTLENENYNLQFVSAYYLNTLPGSLNLMLSEDQAKNLANTIYPLIEKEAL